MPFYMQMIGHHVSESHSSVSRKKYRSSPCDNSRKRPALVTITFVKPLVNCDLNFAMKSSSSKPSYIPEKCPRTTKENKVLYKMPIKYNLYVIAFTVKLSKPKECGITVKARCYRSMKKNEKPHMMQIVFRKQDQPDIVSFSCSCAAGQGFCHHNLPPTAFFRAPKS